MHHSLPRNAAIDGLRALSVVIVIVSHLWPQRLPYGGVGVAVFFVISGYVITAGLLRDHSFNGRIAIGAFYYRRIRRLWPALWAVVAFSAAAAVAGGGAMWAEAAAALLSYMNWARALGDLTGGALGHTWSLAIEEQFYLLWPLTLILLLRLPRRRATIIVAALIIAAIVWRAALARGGATVDRIYNGTDTRADGLLLGCVLAMLGSSLSATLPRCWPIPLGVVLISTVSGYGGVVWGYTAVNLAATWLIVVTITGRSALHPVLESMPFQWIGLRSYSLYLWHLPLLAIGERLPLGSFTRLAVLGATFLAADISYRFIEQRFVAKPRPSRPAASPQPQT